MILHDGTVVSHADVSPHKFGGDPMAEYLWLASNDADEHTGDASEWHYHVARFGKRLLFCWSSGAVEVDRFEDEQTAIEAFGLIDAEYNTYIGEEIE